MKLTQINIEKSTHLKDKPDVNTLGFGKYFTDHMFTAKYTTQKGWFDAGIRP